MVLSCKGKKMGSDQLQLGAATGMAVTWCLSVVSASWHKGKDLQFPSVPALSTHVTTNGDHFDEPGTLGIVLGLSCVWAVSPGGEDMGEERWNLGLGRQRSVVCGRGEVREAGGGGGSARGKAVGAGCLHGPGLRWWTGNYGHAGLVPLMRRVAEGHHNSDVGRGRLPKVCRNCGEVLQHVSQSQVRWRQGNSFCLGVSESQQDKTLFVALQKRDKQSGLQSWGCRWWWAREKGKVRSPTRASSL